MKTHNERSAQWFRPTGCLYCGSDRLSPWMTDVKDRLGYVPGSWSFLRCDNCGSALLSPRPKQEAIAGLYPPVYSFRPDFETNSKLKRILAAIEGRTFYYFVHRNEVATIQRVTGVMSGAVLDVGCGTGDRLARLAKAGYKVRGLEIQPELVQYVRTRLGYKADVGTLLTFSYPADSFNIVTICSVIEHLLDVISVLKKIYGILKPHGWIVAEVPLSDSFQSRRLGNKWSQYCEAPRHPGIPSQEGARRAFAEGGFADVVILPSTIINCAGFFGLSVIPKAAGTYTYGNSSMAALIPRFLAGMVTILYSPMAVMENYFLRRPACALILARKPGKSE
jgi:SAM-dependent methyltransferase